MAITLEEARTLDLFSKHGSIAKTAEVMRKANSAVVYSLGSIESKTGLKVFDRSAYRTKILPAGERILEICQKMLAVSDELDHFCKEFTSGWDPDLKIIVEGIVPLQPIIRTLKDLTRRKIPTRFHVYAEFLTAVENTFVEYEADLMISVLPPQRTALESVALPDVPAVLVAHKEFPLVKGNQKVGMEELRKFSILTVRGSDPRLNMETASIEGGSTIQLNDFHSKKLAIMNGLGFGWMPKYLIKNELKNGQLKLVKWSKSSIHTFKPHLYYRSEKRLGKTARLFIDSLTDLHSELEF